MSPTMMPRRLSARAPRAQSPEAHLLALSPRETPAARGSVPRGRRVLERFGFRDVWAGGRCEARRIRARRPPRSASGTSGLEVDARRGRTAATARAEPRETPAAHGAVPR